MGMIFKLSCISGEKSATLVLTEALPFPKWKCLEGNDIWGIPSSGVMLSSNMTGENIELSLGTILNDWINVEKGSFGKGNRMDDNGGSFPSGEFSWECISKT